MFKVNNKETSFLRILQIFKCEIPKVLLLYEHKHKRRFSNLHHCTFISPGASISTTFLKFMENIDQSETFRNSFTDVPQIRWLQTCNFIKERLQHRCFPVKSLKFLRTSFFTEHLRWLLLSIKKLSASFWNAKSIKHHIIGTSTSIVFLTLTFHCGHTT